MEVYVSGPKVTQGSRKPPFGSAWSDAWARGSVVCSGGGARRKDLGSSTLETEQSTLAGRRTKEQLSSKQAKAATFSPDLLRARETEAGSGARSPGDRCLRSRVRGLSPITDLKLQLHPSPVPAFCPAGFWGTCGPARLRVLRPLRPPMGTSVCACPFSHLCTPSAWGGGAHLVCLFRCVQIERSCQDSMRLTHGQADVVIG